MRNQQPKRFTRLLLAASISIASFSIVACGGSNDSSDDAVAQNSASVTKGAATYLASISGNLTQTTVASWEATSHDDYVNQLQVNGDDLLIIKQWYNGVAKVATSSNNVTGDFVEFGALTTAGHGTESTNEDYVSGATEHKVLDSWFADDDSTMYALIAQPKGDAPAEDDAYGLFKVALNEDGSVPFTEKNGKKIYHQGDAVTRAGQDLKLTDALPLADGRILAMDEKNDVVTVYSSDLQLDESSSFALADDTEIKQWVANTNSVFLLIEGKDDTLMLEKRSLKNLATVAKTVSVDAGSYLDTNANSAYVVLAGGHSVTLFDKELETVTTTTLTNEAEGMSLSTDGKRIALTTEKANELLLLDIDQSKPALTSIQLESGFRRFEMGDKNTLFISFGKGESVVKKISITEKPVAMSADALAQFALDNVTTESINDGADRLIIRKDLALVASGINNVSYQWTSSNDAVINATTGVVTQPAAGTTPASATLTLTTTATLNGNSSSAVKTFNFIVLAQDSIAAYDSEFALIDDAKKMDFRVIATNNDGSKLAAFARRSGKFLLVDTASKDQTVVDLPEEYQYKRSDAPAMVWKDSSTLILVANTEENKGVVLSYDVSAKTWSKLKDIEGGKAYKGAMSDDNTRLTVETYQKESDAADAENVGHVTTFTLSDMTVLSSYSIGSDNWIRNFTTNETGEIIVDGGHEHGADGGHINYLRRVNKGTEEFNLTTSGEFYVMKQVGDKLIAGDSKGNLSVINNAFGTGTFTASDIKTTYTARDKGRDGRTYNLAVKGDKVYAMNSNVGLSVYTLNGTSFTQESFIPDTGIYRFAVSGDDSKIFAYSKEEQEFHVLNLD